MIIKKIKNFNIEIIANSGQCFRIDKINNNIYNIISSDKFLRLEINKNKEIVFHCSKKEFDDYYFNYFDLGRDYNSLIKLCDKNDTFLNNCIKCSEGLRILQQNKFETIISFIISQRKSIKAIKTSIERLCKLCGKKIINKYGEFYAFPTANEILKCGLNKLTTCGLGYRGEYIYEFCKEFVANNYDLDNYCKLNDEELLNKLMEIKGVGIKVASCVALFAYQRFSICPKDVWINRVLDKEYNGKIPKKYEKIIGLVQQYWFNYAILYKNNIIKNK